jgi:23S rRNA (uracil1939-C5)-methyltransferase
LDECHIIGKRTFDAINLFRNIANELGLKAVDDANKNGLLRSALIRESLYTKEIAILLHVADKTLPQADLVVKKMIAKIPEISGIGITMTSDISALATDPIIMLYGRDYITEKINDVLYQVSFRSFFQVNSLQAEKLYQKAIEYVEISPKTRLIDAYCGIGSIGLNVAKKAFKIFGIEIVKQAIMDARKNAELNDIRNAFFEVGDVERVLKKWEKYKFDVIVIDPPRRGCSKDFLDALLKMRIPRIVYVSCDPATLARDLRVLADGGYRIREVTPIDMFPQTVSVESVSLLTL